MEFYDQNDVYFLLAWSHDKTLYERHWTTHVYFIWYISLWACLLSACVKSACKCEKSMSTFLAVGLPLIMYTWPYLFFQWKYIFIFIPQISNGEPLYKMLGWHGIYITGKMEIGIDTCALIDNVVRIQMCYSIDIVQHI